MSEDADFSTLVGILLEIVDVLILVVFALALLVFTWKIIDAWVIHAGEDEKRKEGRKTILVGVIVLVIMSAVWGLVALLQPSVGGAGVEAGGVPIDF